MSNAITSEAPITAAAKSLDDNLIAHAFQNIDLDMVSSLSDSELLWKDSYLDQISVFTTRDFSDAEYKRLTDQFLLELKKPTRTLIRLMCVFITNMDNIFEGKKEKWFPKLLPNQKTVDISDVLDECVGTYPPEDKDGVVARIKCEKGSTESKGNVVTENEKKFYTWLTEDANRSRNTLGALSLGLLRIYCRDPKRWSYDDQNIYQIWRDQLFELGYLSVSISDKFLDDIECQMRLNAEDTRRVIAMCIRRFHCSNTLQSEAQWEIPLRDSFIGAMSHHGLGLERKYEELISLKGWSPSMLKSQIESLKDEAAKKQLENYHKKMRYVAWGLFGEAKPKFGQPFTTNFYMYSRVLNKRFFNSLEEARNKELIKRLDELHYTV